MKKISLIVMLLFVSLFPAFGPTGKAAFASDSESSCNSFGIQTYQEKKQAPVFSLKDLDGNQVSLVNFRGKPVLIVFWATW
jgi:cytochrome oxidase Cu insertion factor (SCO1/SenC/PrrC family)